MTKNIRAQAALTLAPVIRQKGSLKIETLQGEDAALLKELCYGSVRLYPRLNLLLNKLLEKPFKERDSDIHALLILGLYQLFYMRVPDHAVLDQSVRATLDLKKKWAKGLVNAVLRNALRRKDELNNTLKDALEFSSAHPKWLAKQITNAWPNEAKSIFSAGNDRPPMTLRVNVQKTSADDYLAELKSAEIDAAKLSSSTSAIKLHKAVPVSALPGFEEGQCSVQDEAAQWAAEILAPQADQRVLDACAAPGGKTGHLLETEPSISLTALELDPSRTESIESNLNRLKLNATVLCADAADTETWWNSRLFDRILIDAPCSGTGVIRRHPDIKLLRRPSDIEGFAQQQLRLLDALWPLLAQDGLLLYVTCSIMPAENELQMQAFLSRHSDAQVQPLNRDCGLQLEAGQQSLPTVDGPDGFYFSLVRKI